MSNDRLYLTHIRDAIERLAQYMARSPFSLARVVCITPAGKVLCKSEKDRLQRFPEPASEDLFGGVKRNLQLFEPLDSLAELTPHIANKGEHLVRYYRCYSNKACRRSCNSSPSTQGVPASRERPMTTRQPKSNFLSV